MCLFKDENQAQTCETVCSCLGNIILSHTIKIPSYLENKNFVWRNDSIIIMCPKYNTFPLRNIY